MVGRRISVVAVALSLSACVGHDDAADLQYGWVQLPSGPEYIALVDNGRDLVHQGDILFSRADLLDESQAFAAANYTASQTWSMGVVPYQYAKDSSKTFRACIDKQIERWNRYDMGVIFHPHTTGHGSDYVEISEVGGITSSAALGRRTGKQPLKISSCESLSLFHEVGHTIGLIHEHSRRDRDDYVTVHWDNIMPEKKSQFERYVFAAKLGNYDYRSMMHYERSTAAIDPWLPTLSAVGATSMGADYPSSLDLEGIAALYPVEKPALECSVADRETACRAGVSKVVSGYYSWTLGSYWTCGEILADATPADDGLWGQERLGCEAQASQCVLRTQMNCDPPPPDATPPEGPGAPEYPYPPQNPYPPYPSQGQPSTQRDPGSDAGGCSAGSSAGGFLLLLLVLLLSYALQRRAA